MDHQHDTNRTPGESLPLGGDDPLWQVLDEWKSPEVSAGFDHSVMARIRQQELARETNATGWRAWLSSLSLGKAWAASAVLATLVVAVVLMRSPENLTPPAEELAGAEFSAQQVEMALDDLRMLEELYGSTAQEEGQNDRL